MKRDPLCKSCREKMDKVFPSLKEYFEDCLTDDCVSDSTKHDIRKWMKANKNMQTKT